MFNRLDGIDLGVHNNNSFDQSLESWCVYYIRRQYQSHEVLCTKDRERRQGSGSVGCKCCHCVGLYLIIFGQTRGITCQ